VKFSKIVEKSMPDEVSYYVEQLKNQLISLEPYLVLLFGSFAYGNPGENSDIDLLVVTSDDYIPKNFKEHTMIYLKVSQAIRPVKKQIAVDLIVYTLPLYPVIRVFSQYLQDFSLVF